MYWIQNLMPMVLIAGQIMNPLVPQSRHLFKRDNVASCDHHSADESLNN